MYDLPPWMWVTAAVGVVLFVPAGAIALFLWLVRVFGLKWRKPIQWFIFRWNFTQRGFTSWAIHLWVITYNVTNAKLTINLPWILRKEINFKKAGRDCRQRADDVSLDIQWSEPYPSGDLDGLGPILAQKARVNGVWIERRRRPGTATGKVLIGGGQQFPLSKLEDAVNAELRVHGGRVMSDRRFVPLELNEFEEA